MSHTPEDSVSSSPGGRRRFKLIAVGMVALMIGLAIPAVMADHQPADKIAVSGSATEVVGPLEDTTLMSATLKTSSPTDLVLHVSLECAIFTDTSVTTSDGDNAKGNGKNKESAAATGRVEIWLEVDPTPHDGSDDDTNNHVIPVSSDDTGATDPTNISLDDDVPPPATVGKVVFCHRTQGLEAELDFQAEEELNFTGELFLRTYQGTRSANAFNWITLDMGSGTYEIEVHAQIVDDTWTSDDGDAAAKGVIGKRTLVVQPVKLPNDATI